MTEDAVRGRGDSGSSSDAMSGSGPIELDKDGALVGRKKLQPKRAHKDDEAGEDDIPDEAATDGKPKKATLPPKLSLLRPTDLEAEPAAAGPDATDPLAEELSVPAGRFQFGEAKEERGVPAFQIDRYPVTNRQYEAFVRAAGHRPPLYWVGGHLPDELADHPVVGVDYFDALAYATWAGKDLPFEDEWERAARGTDGRTFPWGEENDLSGANTARGGLKCTVPVTAFDANVSPVGCHDMVGNCWEITHSPAPGGGIVVRGGSWYDFALYAKTWFRFAAKADARNGTIGFRCVRREEPRDEAPREVPVVQVEAEMMARTGPQPPVDRREWDPEKRDLVPDYPRLRSFVADAEAERLARMPIPEAASAAAATAPSPEPASSPLTPQEDRTAPEPATAESPETADTPVAASGGEPSVGDEAADPVAEVEAVAEALVRPPIHVEQPRVRSASKAVDVEAGAIERAAEEVARAETVARAEASEEPPRRTSKMLWTLLLLGFALVGAVVVAIIQKQSGAPAKPPAERPTQPGSMAVDHVAKLPDLPGVDRKFDIPAMRVLDGSDADTHEMLAEGNWLLVFSDLSTEPGLLSVQSAHNISLRMLDSGTRVAIVLPRAAYEEGGSLPGPVQLQERIKDQWNMNGVLVILDPAEGDKSLRGGFLNGTAGIAAVVTHEGVLEMKSWAPGQVPQFTVHTLAIIAAEAHALSPTRGSNDDR